MKKRPQGFLSEKNISHKSEVFGYIEELHGYLWRFVRVASPGASGDLDDWLDKAIGSLEVRPTKRAADGFKRSPNCTCDTMPHAPWCVDSKARRR